MASLGPVDYALLIGDFGIDAFALACLIKRRAFTQHFTLFLFLSASIAVGIGRCSILNTFGLTSDAYIYFYFYSDAVLTICLYFILMSLYSHVFSEMGASEYVRWGALLLLAGTAGISYYMVASSTDRLVTHFVIELGQNLYFVGVVLTYLLWGAMVKLRENRTRLVQIVLSMGVYFSLFAGSFALGNLYPNVAAWRYFFPLMAAWLPASWAYTFMKVPEDARLATARVVAPTQ